MPAHGRLWEWIDTWGTRNGKTCPVYAIKAWFSSKFNKGSHYEWLFRQGRLEFVGYMSSEDFDGDMGYWIAIMTVVHPSQLFGDNETCRVIHVTTYTAEQYKNNEHLET